jgi:glycosyltransferase involved in cell wall biosynthesis
MQRARALVYAAEEDFGIVPVEVQACGTPIIAYGKGGVLETVIPGKTGAFFNEQTPEAIIEAVKAFEKEPQLDAFAIRKHAEQFSKARFMADLKAFVDERYQAYFKFRN